MAKVPAKVTPTQIQPTSDFEADFARALNKKKGVRARITEELRKMVDQDPQAFARGIKGMLYRDE